MSKILAVLITLLPVVCGGAMFAQPPGFRDDLRQFRRDFMGVERSYSAANRVAAEQRLAALESAGSTLTKAQFELEIARIVALADNGHTNVAALGRSRRYNRAPVRLVPFGTQFHVLRASGANVDLLGARLLSIDGHDVARLRNEAHALTGGTAGFRDRFAPLFLESPEQLHAAGLSASASQATYVFDLDGRRIERRLTGEVPESALPSLSPAMALYPQPSVTEPGGWRGLLAPAAAPWSLRDAAARFRWREAPELGALVVEMRQNRSTPGHDIEQFQQQVARELRARNPQHAVLDMRMNGGGDLNTTRDLMRALPTLVPGRVFVITSPWTFSAAISSIGYLEQTAPDRVVIVGEQAGDRLEFWSEGRPATLSQTGVVINRATERHDYATGCKPFKDCHGSVVRHPISVRSVAPDIPAPWTIEAYRAGRDPAMEAIAASLGDRRR